MKSSLDSIDQQTLQRFLEGYKAMRGLQIKFFKGDKSVVAAAKRKEVEADQLYDIVIRRMDVRPEDAKPEPSQGGLF